MEAGSENAWILLPQNLLVAEESSDEAGGANCAKDPDEVRS